MNRNGEKVAGLSKRRKIVRGLIGVCFVLALLTRRLYKQIDQATAPSRQFTAYLVAVGGWSRWLGPDYNIEVRDNRSGAHLVAAVQPWAEGWTVFEPLGIRWSARNDEFTCRWGDYYNGIMCEVFKIKAQPLRVTHSAMILSWQK